MEEVVGFTQKQREWFLERDGHRCQFRWFNGLIWVRCRETDHLQIHHLIPRGWCKIHMPHDFEVNGTGQGISLCVNHHVGKGFIHNDTYLAKEAYHHGNHKAIEEMNAKRKELCMKGVPYWNTQWDWMLNRIIIKANAKFLPAHPYPTNARRGYTGRLPIPAT